MSKSAIALAVAAAVAVALSATVQAAPIVVELDVQTCLESTTTKTLDTKKIVAGLGLTPERVRAVRARLVTYNSVRGFAGLDGLGLTAGQIREIERRIAAQVAAMHAHPLGWPCPPFKNQAAVTRYMRAKLISNGFRPASLVFVNTSPRQIQFRGIQDGVSLGGVVVKSGPREITVGLEAPGWGRTYTFRTPFEA